MRNSASGDEPEIVGRQYANGEMRCGHCTHLIATADMHSGMLRFKCNSCKHTNLFEFPGTADVLRARTDLTMAEGLGRSVDALSRAVETFRDFLAKRDDRRLVAVSA